MTFQHNAFQQNAFQVQGPAAPTAVLRLPLLSSTSRRPSAGLIEVTQALILFAVSATVLPFVSQSLEQRPAVRQVYSTLEKQGVPPNDLTLSFGKEVFTRTPVKGRVLAPTDSFLIPPATQLSFGGKSLETAPGKLRNLHLGDSQGFPLPPILGPAPFIPPDFQKPQFKPVIAGPFFPERSLDPGAPAAGPTPFVSITESYPQTKKALSSVFQYPNALLNTDLPPVAPVQWLDSAPKRPYTYSNTSLGSGFIPPVIAGELPFRAPPFDAVQVKAPLKGTFFPARGLDPTAPAGSGIPFLPALDDYETSRKRVQFDLVPNLLHNTLDLPPIATEQSLEKPSFRTRIYSETSLSSPPILLGTPGTKPVFVSFDFFQPKGRILSETSGVSPRILLDTEVLKPFAEIVWPNGVRRYPLYNLAFDSFFSPDKIPEPPPAPDRVEIDVVPKRTTKTPQEEIREIAEAHIEKAVEITTPSLPPVLQPVREIILVPTLQPSIQAVTLNLPETTIDPDDSAEVMELFNLGIL